MLYSHLSVNAFGHLTLGGADTVALAKKYGTPLYLMDEARIRENCRRYTDCLDIMPEGSMILYAGKACCFKDMYRIITEEGMGADVVSSGELFTALSAGFDPSKLFFHGNGKTDTDLECAVNEGIGYIVCDNEDELYALSAVASYCRKTQKILLRLTPGIDPHTHKKIRTGGIDSKFGSLICDGTAERLAVAASHMDGVELCGFHCPIGSPIFDAQPFVDAAEIMSEFCAGLYRNHGIKTKILDLGGGFGVPYTDSDPEFDVKSTVRSIVDEVKRRFGDVALPAIMLEPGRSIVADAGLTVYTCTSVKNAGKTSYTIGTQLTDLLNTDYVVNVTEGAEANSRVVTVTIPANSAVLLTSGYPEEYKQPDYQKTTVIVHCDAGYGNTLYIRGDTLPLDWSSGRKLQNVDANTWVFEMERPVSGSVEFKILLNDETWESGNNHIVQVGNTIEVTPDFS